MTEKNDEVKLNEKDLKNVSGGKGEPKMIIGLYKCPNCNKTCKIPISPYTPISKAKCSFCLVTSDIGSYTYLGEADDLFHLG